MLEFNNEVEKRNRICYITCLSMNVECNDCLVKMKGNEYEQDKTYH